MSEHGCTPELMMEHEGRISAVEQSAASAHHRMDNLSKFTESSEKILVHVAELAGDIKALAIEVKTIAEAVAKHDADLAYIHKELEPRDSIKRLHGRIEELENMYEKDKLEEKDTRIQELEALTKETREFRRTTTKYLIGMGVFVLGALALLGAIVIINAANAGAIPTPPIP